MHTEQTTVTSASASGKKSSRKYRNVKIEIPIMSTPKGKHIVFDDVDGDDADGDDADGGDGPSEFFTPQEDVKTGGLEAQLQEDEEDEDSDDDEAPEAISTSTAAAQAAKATQAAARAAEKQQDNERRKRQERDAKFKKQAETRNEQQKKQAPVPAAKNDDSDSDDNVPAPTKNEPASRLVTALSTSSRKRLDRRTLPSVLPDEFLESDSEAEEEGEEDESAARPKKIKFNTAARQVVSAEARHPADQRVGSTVYRVMKKQGESKLAPRGGKYSKNAREMLLARGRTVPRTSVKKRFLVKG